MDKRNMLGEYGIWAASLAGKGLMALSFRNRKFKSLSAWKGQARSKVLELLAIPPMKWTPKVRVEKKFQHDGLSIEQLSWQLPYGPRTEALFLKPEGIPGRLPAVLALHDHAANKYFGLEKITRIPGRQHPLMQKHQRHYYGGHAWANELAKQGYAVLVHDAFAFGSRRLHYAKMSAALIGNRREPDPGSSPEIRAYNAWASDHESVMAKSLFCAGTTWPGVFFQEDKFALDYLSSRPDVDASRVGCGGLSGGGLRTVLLGGLDSRIKAAVPVGFMSTWKDFLLHKSHTHTWMLYIPHLARLLDFPEIMGLRAPLPTLVMNDIGDSLFSIEGMKAADRILRAVYRKAGKPDHYRCSFYPGPHKFDIAMQAEAFEWFDRFLKP